MSDLRRTIEYPIHDRVTIDRYTPNKCPLHGALRYNGMYPNPNLPPDVHSTFP